MATEELINEMEVLGFNDREEVRRALNRSAGDVNMAAEMLATKSVPKEEDEMDILAEVSAQQGRSTSLKKKHLDPHEKKHKASDPWIPKEAEANGGEIVDQRLQSFKEMGFTVDETEHALKACNNDTTRALDWLLARRSEKQWFSPSPYDVVCEAEDPYGLLKTKKRPDEHTANDPKKGDFYKDLSHSADPAEIIDNRIAEFHSMGFAIADIERALKAAHNDCDKALTLLLNQDTHGFFSDSPQDVLLETDDPYRTEAKKRGHNEGSTPKTDKIKLSNFTNDLPEAQKTNPAAVLDARLSRFLDMGFSVEDAETALEKSNNDVNAALSLLLNNKS